jgi:hypothetical protein
MTFAETRCGVITFNFDRSYERALFRALAARYNLGDERTAALASEFAPLHIHGQLGEPGWLGRGGRAYGTDCTAEQIKTCVKSIRIVFEDVEDTVLHAAQRLLQETTLTCFLGFGLSR